MAYSDYGGFAYRNGENVIERSDCLFGGTLIGSSPGIWPGFVMGAYDPDKVKAVHVVLGDGPVYVLMRKQSTVWVRHEDEELSIYEIFEACRPGEEFDIDALDDVPLEFSFHGHHVTIYVALEDNYYLYVRLDQPDGTVWCGYSGYGVGAGFDGEYGYSNSERLDTLMQLWPDAFIGDS